MSLGTILDAAIGIVFLFTLLSIVVSAIAEQIPRWLSKKTSRAAYLKKAINSLLGNEALAVRFFGHPIYRTLSEDSRSNPSYLSKEHFLDIFIDCIGPQETFGKRGELTNTTDLKTYIENSLVDTQVRKLLLSYAGLAGGDLGKFNESFYFWYEGIMDRASGWYKRAKQRQAFFVGLALAFLLNIDAGSIMGLLLQDEKARSALVSQATEFYEKNRELLSVGEAKDDYEKFVASQSQRVLQQLPSTILGWNSANWNILLRGTSSPLQKPKQAPAPSEESSAPAVAPDDSWEVGSSLLRITSKLLGFFMTAVAIGFGAPFWFDLLGKLVNLRGAGKNPSEEPKDQDKDQKVGAK